MKITTVLLWTGVILLSLGTIANTSENVALKRRMVALETENSAMMKNQEVQLKINQQLVADGKVYLEWLKVLGDDSIDHTHKLRGR